MPGSHLWSFLTILLDATEIMLALALTFPTPCNIVLPDIVCQVKTVAQVDWVQQQQQQQEEARSSSTSLSSALRGGAGPPSQNLSKNLKAKKGNIMLLLKRFNPKDLMQCISRGRVDQTHTSISWWYAFNGKMVESVYSRANDLWMLKWD